VRCTDLSEKQQTIVSSDSFMVTIVAKTYTAKSKTATPRNIWCSNFESTEKQRQRRDNLCSNKMVCNPIKVQRTEKLNIHHQKKYI
jgi:hypothetical protein